MEGNTTDFDGDGEEIVATQATKTQASDELEGNVSGTLSYVLGLVTGIIFYIIDDREFVRFHAAQSIAFSGVLMVAYMALSVLQIVFSGILLSGSTGGFIIGSLVSLALLLVWLVLLVSGFGAWLYMIYKAYQGTTPRMPIAARLADRLT